MSLPVGLAGARVREHSRPLKRFQFPCTQPALPDHLNKNNYHYGGTLLVDLCVVASILARSIYRIGKFINDYAQFRFPRHRRRSEFT